MKKIDDNQCVLEMSHLIARVEIAISMLLDRRYSTASTLYFNDRSRRAALRRVMICVSNLDGAPRETAHAAGRTTERSEKRSDRSGTSGFSLNYRTYATSARVNHLTMPWDGRSSQIPLPPPPFLTQIFSPRHPRHRDQLLMEMRSSLIYLFEKIIYMFVM